MGNTSVWVDASRRAGLRTVRRCASRKMAWVNWHGREDDERWNNVRGWFHRRSESDDVRVWDNFFSINTNSRRVLFLQEIAASKFSSVVWSLFETSSNLYSYWIHEAWISFKLFTKTWNVSDWKHGIVTRYVHTGNHSNTNFSFTLWNSTIHWYARVNFCSGCSSCFYLPRVL